MKPARETSQTSWVLAKKKKNFQKKPSELLDTTSCSRVKVQLRLIIVVNTANNRKHTDLVWLMLMIVTFNICALLSCCAVQRSSGWSVRAPAELPSLPCIGILRRCTVTAVPSEKNSACDGRVMVGCQQEFFKFLGNIQRCRWVLWLR